MDTVRTMGTCAAECPEDCLHRLSGWCQVREDPIDWKAPCGAYEPAAAKPDKERRPMKKKGQKPSRQTRYSEETRRECVARMLPAGGGSHAGGKKVKGPARARKEAPAAVRAKVDTPEFDVSVPEDVERESMYEAKGRGVGVLVDKKNAAYGDSFHKSARILEVLYPEGVRPEQYGDFLALVRVVDKLFRIATDRDALGEDPWADICGYALLAMRDARAQG